MLKLSAKSEELLPPDLKGIVQRIISGVDTMLK
jgi:hypothetical protein